jgi:hypothetical protein
MTSMYLSDQTFSYEKYDDMMFLLITFDRLSSNDDKQMMSMRCNRPNNDELER